MIVKEVSVNMEYAKLGNTDIKVSKLCVGCMSFGQSRNDARVDIR